MTSPRTSQRNRHACARTNVTLQKQNGGYALLLKHYDNNNMAARRLCLLLKYMSVLLLLQMYSKSSTIQL
jgi:hypothetical protein